MVSASTGKRAPAIWAHRAYALTRAYKDIYICRSITSDELDACCSRLGLPRHAAGRHPRRRGPVAPAPARDLLAGRVDRERAGPDPGPEPAADLAPPEDPGRGRAARPVPRGQLGVLPARADRRRRAARAARSAACCPATTPPCGSTSGGWRRCARRAGARPSASSTPAPTPGTASATWRSTRPWSSRRCASCSRAERPASLLDIGTGTGRILQVLAGQIGFGLGIDLSHDMLAVARANLDQREARNCQVRHGDMYQLPLPDASFAAATLHQVLHFADDPFAALAEAARVLAPGGWLVVVDLAAPRGRAAARAERPPPARLRRRGDRPLVRGARPGPRASSAGSPGPELTVVIWTARRPPAERHDDTHLRAGAPHDPGRRRPPRAPPHAWLDEALPPVELSIEVFPPKGPEAAARLWANVEQFVGGAAALHLGHLRRRRLRGGRHAAAGLRHPGAGSACRWRPT